ncbi:MAG: hypothetical protein JWO43_460 [Candidatus Adlerbacteria bacterium]|nr:hypothetical protein [Candidatus Adlerbacteria bacterium]
MIYEDSSFDLCFEGKDYTVSLVIEQGDAKKGDVCFYTKHPADFRVDVRVLSIEHNYIDLNRRNTRFRKMREQLQERFAHGRPLYFNQGEKGECGYAKYLEEMKLI